MTLTEFLLARIAEVESMAERSLQFGDKPVALVSIGAPSAPPVFIAQPQHVLAECEAKRRIVALRQEFAEPTTLRDRMLFPSRGAMLDYVLQVLALPYADHPDYRQEWKP